MDRWFNTVVVKMDREVRRFLDSFGKRDPIEYPGRIASMFILAGAEGGYDTLREYLEGNGTYSGVLRGVYEHLNERSRLSASVLFRIGTYLPSLRNDAVGRVLTQYIGDHGYRRDLATFFTKPAWASFISDLLKSEIGETDDSLEVMDPACGSGTLLTSLALRYPNFRYYGIDVDPILVNAARLNLSFVGVWGKVILASLGANNMGALDLLPQIYGLERSDTLEIGGEGIPSKYDVVIMNPPFAMQIVPIGAIGSKETEEARIRFKWLPERDEALRKLSQLRRLVIKGNGFGAEYGVMFAILGTALVKDGGYLAIILPRVSLNGRAWEGFRSKLKSFDILYVIVGRDREASFSEGSKLGECIIVAKKGREGRETKFINLPTTRVSASRIQNAIDNSFKRTKVLNEERDLEVYTYVSDEALLNALNDRGFNYRGVRIPLPMCKLGKYVTKSDGKGGIVSAMNFSSDNAIAYYDVNANQRFFRFSVMNDLVLKPLILWLNSTFSLVGLTLKSYGGTFLRRHLSLKRSLTMDPSFVDDEILDKLAIDVKFDVPLIDQIYPPDPTRYEVDRIILEAFGGSGVDQLPELYKQFRKTLILLGTRPRDKFIF